MNDSDKVRLMYVAAFGVNCACVGYGLATGNLLGAGINGFLGLCLWALIVTSSFE